MTPSLNPRAVPSLARVIAVSTDGLCHITIDEGGTEE